MRDCNNTTLNRNTVRRDGLCLTVSALCLLAGVPAALAQSATGSGTSSSPYELRGTSEQPVSAGSSGASTLYGALPAPRSGGASPSGSEINPFGAIADTGQVSPVDQAAEDIRGALGTQSDTSQADQDYTASLSRQNLPTGTVDDVAPDTGVTANEVPGFAIGSLTLRPTLDQRIVHETVRFGSGKTSRNYSQTTLSGTLISDWARHQISVEGSGTLQKNLSGTGTESPSADLDAELRLDLINDMTGLVGAGYSYSQESRTDPNAISGASTQAGVHEFRASLGLARNLGLLRGATTLDITRTMYGDATLADGTSVLVSDRDTLGGEITTRIGYQLSPALVPFIEASAGRENYDQKTDSTGSERSSTTYGLRAGAEIDLGEKLSGEFAAGYVVRSLDDNNLTDISGLTLDGELNWSPARGTDVNLGLATTLESATTAGQSGAVVYELDSTLSQQIRNNLVARLSATAGYRDYDSGSGRDNQTSYGAAAGLTWSINRYLDLEADASYERTRETGGTNEETMRLGLGLKLRR